MPGTPELATTYLGVPLRAPFVAGASPLADDLEMVKRLEDAGCAAIVMQSLFEEQITLEQNGRIHHLDPLIPEFATTLSYFPETDRYTLSPEQYLEQLRKIKAAVSMPVIGSLNGTSAESWLNFARDIEQAGADALELNMYAVVTDPGQSGSAIEHGLIQLVAELKRTIKIPIAVKLLPFFTAFGNVADGLDRAGADGLVLFNRFYQPDFDIEALRMEPRIELSTGSDLLLRLQWAAILYGRVHASLAICGGIQDAGDAVKALLGGATVVQIVSAILRNGPGYIAVMREGLVRWMDRHGYAKLDDFRGRLSLSNCEDPAAFERGNYLRTLSSWRPPTPKGSG